MVFGGTSVAAPIIGALYANYGIPTAGVSSTYAARTNLNDVIGGSNGSCRSNTAYLCKAVTGFDGPTGLGSPKGSDAANKVAF